MPPEGRALFTARLDIEDGGIALDQKDCVLLSW